METAAEDLCFFNGGASELWLSSSSEAITLWGGMMVVKSKRGTVDQLFNKHTMSEN